MDHFFVMFSLCKKFIVMILVHLQHTIGEIASIADKAMVGNLLIRRMRELHKRTEEASKVDNSKNSSSMQVDGASNNVSPSVIRCS